LLCCRPLGMPNPPVPPSYQNERTIPTKPVFFTPGCFTTLNTILFVGLYTWKDNILLKNDEFYIVPPSTDYSSYYIPNVLPTECVCIFFLFLSLSLSLPHTPLKRDDKPLHRIKRLVFVTSPYKLNL